MAVEGYIDRKAVKGRKQGDLQGQGVLLQKPCLFRLCQSLLLLVGLPA